MAKSLDRLRTQINEAAPNRSKENDGWIGDTAHAARTSDHNPNAAGVVTAIDITHDPAHGVDGHKLADHLRSISDPRIKYIISRSRIWNPSISSEWRAYSGSNPHDRHVHISVSANAARYDDPSDWDIGFQMLRQTAITATVFGGASDPNVGAYDGKPLNDTGFYVALPYRFPGNRKSVRVFGPGGSAVGVIRDVGPWNTDDPYWLAGTRPQAESGTDKKGRQTNLSGIDLSPALARAVGIDGKGKVDWEFVSDETEPQQPEIKRAKPFSSDVVYLQKLLGFSKSEQDGFFGIETEKAVRWAQRRAGLDVDGIVGDITWGMLEDSYKGEKKP